MTDISKLKAEAESARQKVIANAAKYGLQYPEEFVILLFDAYTKQIALQAAEKEAESTLVAQFNQAVINAQAIDEANPAPIADDGWVTRTGNEEAIVPFYEMVELKFYDGQRSGPGMLASSVDWASPQIIAYRIITPAADRIEE